MFPTHVPIQELPKHEYNFGDLDYLTQQELLDMCDQDIITFFGLPSHQKELLWEKRYYLRNIPRALPKVLLAAHSWEFACLPGLYGLINAWKRPEPMDVLQLFLPWYIVGQKILKSPGQKNLWNQINQFHEKIFLSKIHFLQFQK